MRKAQNNVLWLLKAFDPSSRVHLPTGSFKLKQSVCMEAAEVHRLVAAFLRKVVPSAQMLSSCDGVSAPASAPESSGSPAAAGVPKQAVTAHRLASTITYNLEHLSTMRLDDPKYVAEACENVQIAVETVAVPGSTAPETGTYTVYRASMYAWQRCLTSPLALPCTLAREAADLGLE